MIHIKQTHHKLTNEHTALKMENPNTQIEIHTVKPALVTTSIKLVKPALVTTSIKQ